MKKRINSDEIITVSDYIDQKIQLLNEQKNKLLNDILKINDVYVGNDSNIIINKYTERANKINTILENYENMSKYMKNISGKYIDNLNESKKQINNFANLNTDLTNSQIDEIVFPNINEEII